jgi:hypothetical protein
MQRDRAVNGGSPRRQNGLKYAKIRNTNDKNYYPSNKNQINHRILTIIFSKMKIGKKIQASAELSIITKKKLPIKNFC